MSDNTKIEWCDASWPVIRGCTKCSPGCDNCWAISDAHLHAGSKNAKAAAHFAGLTQIQNGRPNWTGEVRIDDAVLDWPLKWKQPRKVFVASSGDLFHDSLSHEDRRKVWNVMIRAPWHTYLILTKRAENFPRMWPINSPANWWPGVSVEDEERARIRLPWLLKIPAAIRWVSYEPSLGPVSWLPWLYDDPPGGKRQAEFRGRLNWLVIGGESGRGARPFHLDWARDTITQCRAAGVPLFVKQLGARPCTTFEGKQLFGAWKSRKGSDPSEWPEWARVREWPR